MNSFYAKIDTYNLTTYDTNTLSVLLKDNTRLTLRIDEAIEVNAGDVYFFDVEPIVFKDKEQYLVKNITHLNDVALSHKEREILMGHFYDYAPIDIEHIETTINTYLNKLSDGPIKTITMTIFKQHEQAFYLYPAATRFHHAYIGGIAHHTATMLQLTDGFVKTYPYLNHELLIAGVVLHDIFKTVELSNYHAPEYTKAGKLLGHISMGSEAIGLVAEKAGLYDTEARLLLQHMVLSHHYYGNYGSPKKPMIPEALALHYIDLVDSKFAVLGEALKETEDGEFTPSIPVIDRERFYKSKLNNK